MEEAKIGDKVLFERETDEISKKIDRYCCSIKVMVDQPQQLKTEGHIPKEFPGMFITSWKRKTVKPTGLFTPWFTDHPYPC